MITITGTVGSSGKYLVTGIPVDTQTHTVLKIEKNVDNVSINFHHPLLLAEFMHNCPIIITLSNASHMS